MSTLSLCHGCGGPHRFDTSVPSVIWNAVIRAAGHPDYLCTACIVRIFALAGRSFTATLWSDEFNGVPIEVRIREQLATDAHALVEENNTLRSRIHAVLEMWDEHGDQGTGTPALWEAMDNLRAALNDPSDPGNWQASWDVQA